MPAPDGATQMTGRMKYRETWRGSLVLQIEVIDHKRLQFGDPCPWYWRDARWRDIRAAKYHMQRNRGRLTNDD